MDIVQMLEYLEEYGYWIVAFFMTIESTVIPFPSEVVVAPAAFLAATSDKLNIYLVVLFATLGANVGASINYWVSYYVGRPIVYKFANSKWGHLCLLDQEKVEKAEKYFDEHGATATLIGRLIPVIRQLISVPAGLAKMNFWHFLLYTTIGAGAWNIVLATLGWVLAQSYPDRDLFMAQVEKYNSYIGNGILVLVVLCICYLIYNAYKKGKK